MGGTCFYPPHLDNTGRPMRWDWQIGRVAPLERKGAHAVDMYDVDGFLTTTDEITAMHTEWQAATLPHPKVSCYLDLAWEAYRPDGSTEPRAHSPLPRWATSTTAIRRSAGSTSGSSMR